MPGPGVDEAERLAEAARRELVRAQRLAVSFARSGVSMPIELRSHLHDSARRYAKADARLARERTWARLRGLVFSFGDER